MLFGHCYFSKHHVFLLDITSFCVELPSLSLEKYREKIKLDVIFSRYSESELRNTSSEEILSKFTSEIMGEYDIGNSLKSPTIEQIRNIVYRYIITRKPKPIAEEFLSKINFALQQELQEKQVTNEEDIPVSLRIQDKEIKLWKGDITVLAVDSIVNAANNRLLGCWIPGHRCIDNVIHANAGPQVRIDCNTIMTLQGHPEPTGIAKLTKAYNLPSKFILHTVGPIWNPEANLKQKERFREELKNSYISCLNLATQFKKIQSIAFCCISTGEFGFPQELAAKIAFEAVLDWCKSYADKTNLKTIIFNTFLESDDSLYKDLITNHKMMNESNGKN